MIEILGGIVLTLIAALYFVYNSWQSERGKRSEAEEKVLALEVENEQIKFKQNVSSELDNASDVYLANVLRSKSE
ncbi:coil containing protein [Vibrio phage 1.135.O._10N.222.54.B6]|nr:coil containing protein [Vibrio phage 1.135.O._10N.222.54.B6]